MSSYPEILAGYAATVNILGDKDINVRHVGQGLQNLPKDPIALMASFPPAYSVEVMVLREGANLLLNKRFGFLDDTKLIEWPVATDSPDFEEKLREVLIPAVEVFERKAAAERERAMAEDPNGPHESRDAIRRIS